MSLDDLRVSPSRNVHNEVYKVHQLTVEGHIDILCIVSPNIRHSCLLVTYYEAQQNVCQQNIRSYFIIT